MANTFFGLNIGTTGLYAAKNSLNITAHNVANIETEGYSRQVIKQTAATPLSTNNKFGMLGSGVDVKEITQMRSKYYDEKYRSNNSVFGKYESRSYFMNEVQTYLNEIELEGFTVTFDNMYNALQDLSKDPANLTVRTQTSNFAQSMCEYFNSLSQNLSAVQQECNFEVKNQVNRINSLANQVAVLTKQINTVEIGGENANDLRDQRENLIDQLSQLANVTTEERVRGTIGATEYVVRLDGHLLVDSYEAKELELVPRTHKMNQNDVEGLYDLYWDNGEKFNIESASLSGTLKALFEVRDGNNEENLKGYADEIDDGAMEVTISYTNINDLKDLNIPQEGVINIGKGEYTYSGFAMQVEEDGTYTYTFQLNEPARRQYDEGTMVSVGVTMDYKGIPYYHAQLNEFVRVFAQQFNQVHASGTNLNGEKDVNFFSARSPLNLEEYELQSLGTKTKDGGEFNGFDSDPRGEVASYYMLTAGNFTVCDKIMRDPAAVTAASTIVDGVSNADVVNKLLALKTDISMFKQGDPAAFLQTLVGEVGVDTKSALNSAKSQQNIVQSVTSQRLSVAGVDIDEEAMNLAKYQEAYSLSAKVIAVMNQTYDTLINNLGI